MLIGQLNILLIFTNLIAPAIPAKGEFFGLFEIYRGKTLQVLAVPSALYFVLSFFTLLSNADNDNFFSWHSLLACLHEVANFFLSAWFGLIFCACQLSFLDALTAGRNER